MFVWIELTGIKDSFELVSQKAVQSGVLLVPGKEFYPIERIDNHVRASFSVATLEQMDLGISRLAALL